MIHNYDPELKSAIEKVRLEEQVKAIKTLGEQMGYSHLMSLASALWRQSLTNKGYNDSGASFPVSPHFIKTEVYDELNVEEEITHYNQLIDSVLKMVKQ